MKHAADDIDGVLRRGKVLVELFVSPVGILHLHVPPGVDVNLLNAVTIDVFREKAELGHFGVECVNELSVAHAVNRETFFAEIIRNIAPERLALVLAAAGDDLRVGRRNIVLCLAQDFGEIARFLWHKKDAAGATGQSRRGQNCVGIFRRHGFGRSRNCRRNALIRPREKGSVSSFA